MKEGYHGGVGVDFPSMFEDGAATPKLALPSCLKMKR